MLVDMSVPRVRRVIVANQNSARSWRKAQVCRAGVLRDNSLKFVPVIAEHGSSVKALAFKVLELAHQYHQAIRIDARISIGSERVFYCAGR